MRIGSWTTGARTRLDVTAGLVDGILSALTLAAGRLLKPGGGATVGLALRVGAATSLTTLFVFFVAHYAEFRAELARSEKELNLTEHGNLAAGRLGAAALRQAAAGGILAVASGSIGAMAPLFLCVAIPRPRELGIVGAIILLGVLGALLARSFDGRIALWSLAIMAGGVVLTFVGIALDITA